MTQSKKAVPQRGWIRAYFCTFSGVELVAGLVGVDRLVLGGVVLEHAPQVGEQRDQDDVDDEDARPGSAPSTITNQSVPSIGSQLVSSAGPTLKSISAKPIAIANEKMIWPREISVGPRRRPRPRSCARVVRRDGERAEADRERLAERDTPRIDRQPQRPVALHRRARSAWSTSAISPSGLRTATDQSDGPRIITPSSTAWPPIRDCSAADDRR